MGRRSEDAIDVICKAWAREFRRIRGLDDKHMEACLAREFIGAVRSTLGDRRDLHAGSTSTGRVEQHFPEVFTPDSLRVNLAIKAARQELREVLVLHYAHRAPPDEKAEALNVSVATYWNRVSAAKHWLEGRLST
jgi:DNA-directed RNA polymerase specialized sigma24 family protein